MTLVGDSHRTHDTERNKIVGRNQGEMRMRNKIALALIIGAALPGHAVAQTEAPPSSDVQTELEPAEILVTAQRREQNIQDVPIAISAFGGERLQELGISSVDELTQFVPGAELFDDRGSGQPSWVIRGVGLADFNSNNTPTAAVYYDDFYLTSNVMGGVATFDIDRVEVLKGPQGGLYGRNTTGGAVTINSTRPSLSRYSGYLRAHYGRWDQYGVEAAVGGPISENLAFRLAATGDFGGGWQDSLATPRNDRYGDRKLWAARGQILATPTDGLELLFKLDVGADKSETTLAQALGAYDLATGDFCAAVYAGRRGDADCVGFHNLTNALVLTPGEPGVLPSAQDKSGRVVLANPINRLDNKWTGISLRASQDLAGATLTSITGYLKYRNRQYYDYDATPLTLFHETPGTSQIESWSQELRLVSNGGGALSWLVGALYAKDTIREDRAGQFNDNFLAFGGILPEPFVSERLFRQRTESWAVYAQLGYDITNTINLNGSLRYTEEDKDLLGYTHLLGPRDTGFPALLDENRSLKLGTHLSGHIGIDWKPDPDTLIYGKITRGFKSGGFFGGFALNPAELDPYREETVWSYEAGFKTEPVKGLKVNGAVYYYDYRDVQGFIGYFDDLLGQTLTKLGNIGNARHVGAELDLLWQPRAISGLTLQASGAWLDAKITDSTVTSFSENGTALPLKGLDRSFAPKLSLSALARMDFDIGDQRAAVQLSYSWRDDLVTRKASLTDLDYGLSRHAGYGLLNARLSLADTANGWEVALSGENLLDKAYALRVNGDDVGSFSSLPGQPRQWKVEAKYSF